MKKATLLTAALLTSGIALAASPAAAASATGSAAGNGAIVDRVTPPGGASGDASEHASGGDVQTFRNGAFGGCMDDYRGKLWLRACDDSNEQEWEVTHDDNYPEEVYLQNVDTGDCLADVWWDGGLTTEECGGWFDEAFEVKRWNDGTIRFRNVASDECVDVDSDGDIGTRECDASESQSWY